MESKQACLRTGLAKVVVFLVLLVWWMDIPHSSINQEYQVLEFFAGVGRIASLAKLAGFHAVPIDLSYGEEIGRQMGKRSPMDLNSNSGMVFPVCILYDFLFGIDEIFL